MYLPYGHHNEVLQIRKQQHFEFLSDVNCTLGSLWIWAEILKPGLVLWVESSMQTQVTHYSMSQTELRPAAVTVSYLLRARARAHTAS